MNKELKEQARKEFAKYLDHWDKMQGIGIYRFDDKVIDSLIDKTVQQTEERIANMIREYAEPYENSKWFNEVNPIKIISLITNKNDNK